MNRLLLRDGEELGPGGWPQAPETTPAERLHTARVGLRLLLAAISSLFLLFLLALLMRSQVADWQPLTDPLAPLAQPWPLWLNSAVLLAASLCLQGARLAARRTRMATSQLAFAAGGLLALIFLLGQLWFWQRVAAWGYPLAGNPANSFFYLLTGLHGLHLLGGLAVWAWALATRLRRPDAFTVAVELCASYWHYLLGLWLLLFAVLTSSPQTYQAIAAFCGLR
jgi:cytochrome c oxidase subunit 3